MVLFIISYESFRLLNFGWMAIGVITFIALLRINAPYGRHTTPSWGPMISNRFAWFIMELPVLIIVGSYAFLKNANLSAPVFIMAALFCAHYIHRSIIFPLRLHTRHKQMPAVIMGSAIVFNLVNGFLIGYYFRNFAHYEVTWLSDPRFIGGMLIFLTGMTINLVSDTALISLRKPGENGYKIPEGFLFRLVSCPNHFGEMLEWLGFALLCWNLPALTFFIWTAANLIPRALAHHRWYHQNFPEYPASRKAVIPFLI